MRPPRERVEQPRSSHLPVAFDSGEREVEDVARFLQRQSAKEPQLCDAALACVERGEPLERGIEVEDIDVNRLRHGDRVIERDLRQQARSLRGPVRASVIDQDAAHHRGRHTKELCTVAPRDPSLVDEAEIGLVNECRRLQGVAGSLAAEVGGRAAAQLVVDERHEPVARADIARAPGLEELRDPALGRAHATSAVEFWCCLIRPSRLDEQDSLDFPR